MVSTWEIYMSGTYPVASIKYQHSGKHRLVYIRAEQDLLEILDLELLRVKNLVSFLFDAFFILDSCLNFKTGF